MTQDPKTLRIAIIVDREDASCLPLSLPFSVVGYPLIQIEFFKTDTPSRAAQPPLPLADLQTEAVMLGLFPEQIQVPSRPLAELKPEAFDLILDWQNWTAQLPGYPPEGLANLVTGPGTPFLERILCQFQELRQKHEINAGIILHATDGIITIDENHTIIGYNYGAERIFGYPRTEALGQDLNIIIPPPHRAVHREYVRRYVATRQARVIGRHVQINAQRRDGTEFPMSISFSVAEIRGHLYFTGIVRDISEYKQMEDRLLQSERLAAIGNTVTHIAHEIKNPLLIIGGFARQLLKAPGLDEKSQRKLALIADEVARLEQMVAEMRDFLHPPASQKSLGQMEDVLEEALEFFQDAFKERYIQVHRRKEGALPPITFDPKQIRQVLLNLFKNALEAMPRGGELTVASRVSGPHLELSVTDSGEGMSPEVAAHIFQPYYTTKEKGSGLGLAVCQSIVKEQHGGLIDVESALGQGSTFTIRLPLKAAAA